MVPTDRTEDEKKVRVVLDTNVFVAAGFNARSDSAKVIRWVREGRLSLVWNEETRSETERILRKIPPLSWDAFEDLFQAVSEYRGAVDVTAYDHIPDLEDRKFAALAEAAGAMLVTQDTDLLMSERADRGPRILRPGTFAARISR